MNTGVSTVCANSIAYCECLANKNTRVAQWIQQVFVVVRSPVNVQKYLCTRYTTEQLRFTTNRPNQSWLQMLLILHCTKPYFIVKTLIWRRHTPLACYIANTADKYSMAIIASRTEARKAQSLLEKITTVHNRELLTPIKSKNRHTNAHENRSCNFWSCTIHWAALRWYSGTLLPNIYVHRHTLRLKRIIVPHS